MTRDGLYRSAVPYIWPPTLTRAEGSRSIYLDLNHWIGLAKARAGHRDGGRHRPLLEAARQAVANGTTIFPLSGQHYMEMSGIKDPRQREDIANVMVELSRFRTLISRAVVMKLEVESVLDARVGTRDTSWAPLPTVGVGFGPAFGIAGLLQIKNNAGDSQDTIRQNWPGGPHALDKLQAELQYMAEWEMLAGPKDSDLEQLNKRGFDPSVARRVQEDRALEEIEQVNRFSSDPRWRRGRIRDVVAARYVIVELMDMLMEGATARGASLEDVFGGERDDIRAFVDSMPSGDVHVSLQVAAHRNPQSTWTSNDIFDIDALALAVPYCDVVVTERRRAHDLHWSGFPERLDTVILRDPAELLQVLADDDA